MNLSFLILFGVLIKQNTSFGIESPSIDVTSLNKTIVEKMAEVLRLENETVQVEEMCGTLKKEIDGLMKRTNESSVELNEMERIITKNDEEVKKLGESVRIAEVDCDALMMQRRDIMPIIMDLTKEVEITRDGEMKAKMEIYKNRESKERLDKTEKLEKLKRQRHHLKKQIESYMAVRNTLLEKFMDQQKNLLKLREQLMTHKDVQHGLESEKAMNTHRLRIMENELQTAEASLIERSAHLVQLVNAKSLALKELKQLREDLEKMKERDEVNRLASISKGLDDLVRFSVQKGTLKLLIEQTSLSSINKTLVEKRAEVLRLEEETTKTEQSKEYEMKKVAELKAKLREMRNVTEIISREEKRLSELKRKESELTTTLDILSSEFRQIDDKLKMKNEKKGSAEEKRAKKTNLLEERDLLKQREVHCSATRDTIIKTIHEKERVLDALSEKLAGCNEKRNTTTFGWTAEAERCLNTMSLKLSEREKVFEDKVKHVNDLENTKSVISHELIELADKYDRVEKELTARRQELGTVTELHQSTLTRLKTLIGITK